MLDKTLFDLPGIKKVLLILAGFAVLEGLLIFGQAWSLSSAITGLWLGNPLQSQLSWTGFFVLCFVGIQLVRYLRDQRLDHYAFACTDDLRQQLMQTIFSQGLKLVQKNGTGNTTTLLLEGTEQVETYLRLVLNKMVRLVIIPVLMLIPIFILDWVSGLIMLLVFPFIIVYMVILGRTARDKATRQHHEFQMLANHFVDSLRGIDTLKFFGLSAGHGKSIYAVSERFRKATMRTLRTAILSSSVLDLFATLSVAAVAIMLGLRLLDGTLFLFPALTVLILAPEYFKVVREFASDYHASLDGRNALSSLLKMINSDTEDAPADNTSAPVTGSRSALSHTSDPLSDTTNRVTNRTDPLSHPSPCPGTDPLPSSPAPFWNAEARFSVDDLNFSYEDFEALKDITFTISGPRKVGIIGASGAGKSTLTQILGGFAAASAGQICVDGTPLCSSNQASWQQQLAYLPQDPYIFHASLRENISFYTPDATDEEVARAIEVVGLQSLIDELPEGLSTRIGEGARSLSGGQAQRVALARICLDKKRSVLLFDEPTAHLDIETELELKERMLPLMQDKLVFFATHRLHWMHDMDLILVMDEGAIVEQGTYAELQSRGSFFAALASGLRGGGA